MIIFSELANALSMLSPLVCWFRHRRRHAHTRLHKMMIVHIPISALYHLSCALPRCKAGVAVVRRVLRIADLVLIHVFSLTAAEDAGTVPRAAKAYNGLCIYRTVRGHDDTLLRLGAVSTCAYFGLRHYASKSRSEKKKVMQLCSTGTLACALYVLDAHLHHVGHSLFHVVLGMFQSQLFDLFGEGYTSKALFNP